MRAHKTIEFFVPVLPALTVEPRAREAEASLTIVNEVGMHARAATLFVQTASRFDADIHVEKDGEKVNGKSIVGILMLVAAKGTTIRLEAAGRDAVECVAALSELVRRRFDEAK